jgi:hypothetical protein
MLRGNRSETPSPSTEVPLQQAGRRDESETMPKTFRAKRPAHGARADEILSASGLARLQASVSNPSTKTVVRSRRVGRLSVSRLDDDEQNRRADDNNAHTASDST